MKNATFALVAIGIASIAAIAATSQFLNNANRLGPAAQSSQNLPETANQAPSPDSKPATAEGAPAPAPTPGTPDTAKPATAPAGSGTAAPDAKPDEDEADKDPYEGIAPEELPPDLQYNADSSVSFPTNI